MQMHGLEGAPSKRIRGVATDSTRFVPSTPNLLKRDISAAARKRVRLGDITSLPTRIGTGT